MHSSTHTRARTQARSHAHNRGCGSQLAGSWGPCTVQSKSVTHLDQQLACTQNEPGVRVPDASGELPKGTGVACVGVSAKQHLPRLAVALLRENQRVDCVMTSWSLGN